MKTSRSALLVVAVLWVCFAGYVWLTASQLPERVATHFGAGGEPNGWMTRAGHVEFTLLFGTLVPAFILGIFAWIRSRGGWGLNIPHKEYWLSPERRQDTFDYIQRHGFWFAGLFIAFLAGVHHSILVANAHPPAALRMAEVGWVAGGFGVAILLWVALLIARFCRKPA